ncbi:hypothetical protein BAY1663_00895 [Pseudomonas sp. BAY1663]|nr:hypothetical protein BAY1663_00895 [Pseudomonas sp. BAY1663]
MAAGIAYVDAIQAQQWPARREGLGHLPLGDGERLVQPRAAVECAGGFQPPVVEVAGHHHRRAFGKGVEQIAEQFELLLAVGFAQPQVHADRVEFVVAGHLQHAVQQPAAFRPGDGDV